MRIIIEDIPHAAHRYPTVGDWYWDTDGDLHVKVSRCGDKRYERLLMIHELVEALTCDLDGVSQAAVDKFDMEFEQHRHPDDESEPGDNPEAPYRKQHCLATGMERILAGIWGVRWSDYEQTLNSL